MTWLTDEDRERISTANRCIHGKDCEGCPPLYAAVESLIAAHRRAAWQECHESGTPWDNPYAPPAEKGSEG